MEELTLDICREYREKARQLNTLNSGDIGPRKVLRQELQQIYGLSEVQAINVLNGYMIQDILMLVSNKRNGKVITIDEEKREFMEWQAQKEEEKRYQQMVLDDERR